MAGVTRTPREVVEALYATINAHDPAGGRDLFAPDAHIVAATGRTLTLAGLGQLLLDTLAAFPDARVRVTRWIESDDLVVTEELLDGTHRGSFAGMAATGRRVELRLCHVHRVEDGRIVERIAYHDTAGVLRQLT